MTAQPAATPTSATDRLTLAQEWLGYVFLKPDLLREALTHRSAAMGRARATARAGGTPGKSNERLEFIGDRVLGLVIAEWLAERFPAEPEGALGPRLAHLVSREAVAEIGRAAGLSRILTVGQNEATTGVDRLANVVADAMEAVIGALFLDGGLEIPRKFIRAAWRQAMEAQILPPKDPKTALQEWLLARGQTLPHYEVASAQGPSHAPQFRITVAGGGHLGVGEAGSKRAAERIAAADLLARLT